MKTEDFGPGDCVTVHYDERATANTFFIDLIDGDSALIYHLLYPSILMRVPLKDLNKTPHEKMGGTQKTLEFCVEYAARFLSFEDRAMLETYMMFFVMHRFLTQQMKKALSDITGKIAKIRLSDDVQQAIHLVQENQDGLDAFNKRWFDNYQDIFSGKQLISSKAQICTIFNMAGHVLAETKNSGGRGYDQEIHKKANFLNI